MRYRFAKMTAWMMILALLLNMIPAFAEFSLPQGLTVIESEAFSNVPLQGIVTLPGIVSVVEEGAFFGEELLSLTRAASTVSTIYGTAFNNCPSTITIYGQSGSYAETLADSYGYAFVAGSLTM